jgi:hypothetical protein
MAYLNINVSGKFGENKKGGKNVDSTKPISGAYGIR